MLFLYIAVSFNHVSRFKMSAAAMSNSISGGLARNIVQYQGRIQEFHLEGGGGGAKDYCASMHIASAEANSHSAGFQLKFPGSSRVVLMLSRAI